MSRGISLTGLAAAAFMRMASGKPETEEEKLESLATGIYMAMKSKDMPGAVRLLKLFKEGTL